MSKIDIGDTLGGDPRKAAFGGAINLQTIEESMDIGLNALKPLRCSRLNECVLRHQPGTMAGHRDQRDQFKVRDQTEIIDPFSFSEV